MLGWVLRKCEVFLRRPPRIQFIPAAQDGETAPPARKAAEPVGAAGGMQDDMLLELVGQDYGMVMRGNIYLHESRAIERPFFFVFSCFLKERFQELSDLVIFYALIL